MSEKSVFKKEARIPVYAIIGFFVWGLILFNFLGKLKWGRFFVKFSYLLVIYLIFQVIIERIKKRWKV